jgi:hypothetical protein
MRLLALLALLMLLLLRLLLQSGGIACCSQPTMQRSTILRQCQLRCHAWHMQKPALNCRTVCCLA